MRILVQMDHCMYFLYNIFMTFDDACEEEVDEETEIMKSLEKLQRALI